MAAERRARLIYEPLDDLAARARPENPKRHHLSALDASLQRFGYVSPVTVSDSDGRILEGHGRVEALLIMRATGLAPPFGIRIDRAGHWHVPTILVAGLSADDALAYTLAANRISELGGWDEDGLAKVLADLAGSALGLHGVGFSELDLATLVERLGDSIDVPKGDPDAVPEEPPEGEVYVRPGQLWRLGQHVVMCGDATSGTDVSRLLAGRKADLAITDPPYNVNLGRHGGSYGPTRRRRILNDALAGPAWEDFVGAWAHHLIQSVDGALYVFMSSKELPTVSRLLEQAGGHWSDTIIWAKGHFVLGRADYHRQYEALWYGWREGARHYWCGDRSQGDVWSVPRPAASPLHPTTKPVAVIERAMANSSRLGARVLDLFLGSGTTLIAAERLGRRCLGMDLEPRYVQIAVERWQRYTGRHPELEEA